MVRLDEWIGANVDAAEVERAQSAVARETGEDTVARMVVHGYRVYLELRGVRGVVRRVHVANLPPRHAVVMVPEGVVRTPFVALHWPSGVSNVNGEFQGEVALLVPEEEEAELGRAA